MLLRVAVVSLLVVVGAVLSTEIAQTTDAKGAPVSLIENAAEGTEWMKGVRDENTLQDSDRKELFTKCVDSFTFVYKLSQSNDAITEENMAKCANACSAEFVENDDKYDFAKYKGCYSCCDSYYGRAPSQANTREFFSCAELKKAVAEAVSGENYLHDKATGEVFKTTCDQTNDDGGWTLVSDFDFTQNRYVLDVSTNGMKQFLSEVVGNMETRFEAYTQTRVYKRYQQNAGIRGLDHFGTTAYQSRCKLRYADGWGSELDWGLNEDLKYNTAFTHIQANNKGPGNWRYNVMSACHRALSTADGTAKYIADFNTPGAPHGYPNTFCGGIRAQKDSTEAAGCYVNHRFLEVGPEGQDPQAYLSRIPTLRRIKIWVRAVSGK